VIWVDRASLEAQGATPEEAAAAIAAILRFARDTAASEPASHPARADGWLRAGRLEAVGALPEELGAWGDWHPWSK
jgi:hypothetical protein